MTANQAPKGIDDITDAVRKTHNKIVSRVEVIEIQPPQDGKLRRVQDGSILAITGRASSGKLDKMAAAANEGSLSRLDELLDEAEDEALLWLLRHRKEMLPIAVVTDYYYSGKEILKGHYLPPGLDTMISVMPFLGGSLDSEAFESHVYSREDGDETKTLLLICQPNLSEVERQILAKVAEDPDGPRIGKPTPDDDSAVGAALALIVVFALITASLVWYVAHQMTKRPTPQMSESLQEELRIWLEEIDPGAAATALLEARSKMIASGALWM